MIKRTWIYIHEPKDYEIHCDLCQGTNITWSEWEGMIWCYDCQKDTKGFGGIFEGPIPFGIMPMLSISLDRIDLATGKRNTPKKGEDGHIEYVEMEGAK